MAVSVRSLEGAALAVLVVLSPGCAGRRVGGAFASAEQQMPEAHAGQGQAVAAMRASVVLAVTNRGFADVIVYLVDGGVSTRVGRVAALERSEIAIHNMSSVAAPVRVLLRSAGSGVEYAPDPIWARAGEVVDLTIQPLLTTSQMTPR